MTLGDNKFSKKKVAVAASFVLAFVACGPIVGCGGDDTEPTPVVVEDTGSDTGSAPVDTGTDTGSPDTGEPDSGTPDSMMMDAPVDPTATPVFMPAPGTFTTVTNVTMTSATPGAVIYYTTDGTDPNTSSPKYTAAIALTKTTTIKAMALAPGFLQSTTVTGTFTINIPGDKVVPVTFTPGAGTYDNDQSVALASTTPAATICYTLDGTAPSCDEPTAKCSGSSATYNASTPITINTTGRQIRAIGCKVGMTNSDVTAASYTLTAASAVFTPGAGTYDAAGITVTASLATAGGVIRYTTDGTDPNCTTVGSVFSTVAGGLPVAANTTLKAITCKTGYNPSPVQTVVYNVRAGNITATPAAGNVNNETTVTLAGASLICYRLDGTDPTCTSGASPACGTGSTAYAAASAPKFDKNTTVKAVGCDATHVQGNTLTAAYNFQVGALTFNPIDGTAHPGTGNLVISTTTLNTAGDVAADQVKAHYTTDSSAPSCTAAGAVAATCTAASCSISIPFSTFPAGTTIRAIFCKTDYASATGSARYNATAALPQPTITPTQGTYINDQTLTMDVNGGPADATICYTMGTTSPGVDPTCTAGVCGAGSTTYSATAKPVANQSGLIVKAISCKAGQITSSINTQDSYTFNVAGVEAKLASAPTPITSAAYLARPTTVNVGYGEVLNFEATNAIPSTASSVTSGVTFRYTTDGSVPTCASGTAAASYTVNTTADVALRVVGCKAGFNPSAVSTFNLHPVLGAPILTPLPKTPAGLPWSGTAADSTVAAVTNSPVVVTLSTVSSAAPGAKICYTTDGSAPACDGSLVCTTGTGVVSGATVAVSTSGTVVRALTCATGFTNSTTSVGQYHFKVTRLKFSPANPAYTTAAGTAYAVGDIVHETAGAQRMFRALKVQDGTTANPYAPLTDATAWQVVASTNVTISLDSADPQGAPTNGAKLCYRTDGFSSFFDTTPGAAACTPVAGTTCVDPASASVPPGNAIVPVFSTSTRVTAIGCKAGYTSSTLTTDYNFAPYRNSISMTSGSNNFAAAAEALNTSTAGTTAYATWGDAAGNYLYVGLQGPEAVSTSSGYLHFYTAGSNLGGVTATPEPGFGTTTLPSGDFTHHFRFRLDSTIGSSDMKISTWNGTSWTVGSELFGSGADIERGGTGATSFIKVRVPIASLGLSYTSGSANSKTKLVGAVWSGSANTAGFPQTAAGGGTPFAKYLAIDFISALNPNTAANVKP